MPAENAMTQILIGLTDIVTSMTGVVTSVATTVVGTPILLIPVLLGFIYGGIALFQRLRG